MNYWNTYDSIFLKENNEHPRAQTEIGIYFLYVDCDNEIIKIKKQNVDITDSTLNKDRIMKIITTHSIFDNSTKYCFDKLLKYSVICNIDDIENIHNDSDWDQYLNSSFTEHTICSDVHFDDSLVLLQDINSLFIFYKEKPKSILKENSTKTAITKKVRFSGSQPYTRKHK